MSSTKLSRYCEHVIEAGWLAAVIVVPLFFNVYSSRVFEPDKLSLLRSIALIMALAWIVKFLDTGLPNLQSPASNLQSPISSIRNTPLVLPTLMLVAAYLISTAASVAPRLSLWGSYQRLQGTYTTLSYIVIFLLLLEELRTRDQLERLITAVILASLPVALYGLIQHYKLDPLPWQGDVTKRVASSMGNSIFVAAYLIMVVPLTLMRLMHAFTVLVREEKHITAAFLEATGYLFILMTQVLTIFFSQSRGPWLGLMGGLFVFGLLWAVTRQARRLVLGATALAVLFAAFLVVFNLPHTPLEPIKELPYIGRLGRVFETQSGTGRVRVLIWEGTVKMITAHPLRTLIGYGPETMHVAYNPYYPPDLAHYEARNASPDRSHNETFDALVITGVVGFLAYLFLFVSLFYFGLRWLGLITDRRARNRFLALIGAGGLLSVLGFQLADPTGRFFGVALPAGMMVGFFVYLIWTALRGEVKSVEHPFQPLLIALLAAVIAHFIEIHFGIAIAATRTLFWTYAGVLVVAGYFAAQRPALVTEAASVPVPAPTRTRGGRRSRGGKERRGKGTRAQERGAHVSTPSHPERALFGFAGITSLILLTIAYDFVTNPARESGALSILWHALTAKWESGHWVTAPGILWLWGLTWLFATVLSVARLAERSGGGASTRPASNSTWWLQNVLICGGISLVAFLLFALVLAARLVPPPSNMTLEAVTQHLANHITAFYLAVFLWMFLLAAALTRWSEKAERWWSGRWQVWVAPALAVLTFLFLVQTNLNEVRADILYKQAWLGYHQPRRYDAAIAVYREALRLRPDQDYYYLFLGKAYLEKAQSVSNAEERERLLQQADRVLERARELNPLNPDHTANLARLYQTWGRMERDPAKRKKLLEKALEYHREATQLAPHAAHLYNEWAMTLDLLGRYDEALEKLEHSRALDDKFADTPLFMGEVYRHAGKLKQAIEAYKQALALDPKRLDAHRGLALIYAYQGRVEEAIAENQQVLALNPRDLNAYQSLATLYEQRDRLDDALQAARKAAELAPNDPVTQVILGDVHRLRGELQAAIDAYQQALTRDPQLADAHAGLALVYEAQGKRDAALDQARQALSLRPNNQTLQALVQRLEGSTTSKQ